jgi:hypothetical protein
VISASPPGRKAMPHGIWMPVAITSGAAVRSGFSDGRVVDDDASGCLAAAGVEVRPARDRASTAAAVHRFDGAWAIIVLLNENRPGESARTDDQPRQKILRKTTIDGL